MSRIKIDRHQATGFIYYLNNCINTGAKTIDTVKEYMLASVIKNVVFKLQVLGLKYDQQPGTFKVKAIKLADIELIALSIYFKRYQMQDFLLPVEYNVLEAIKKTPHVSNILSGNIVF